MVPYLIGQVPGHGLALRHVVSGLIGNRNDDFTPQGFASEARYERWLARQPLAERTRGAYVAQVRGFLTWLAGSEHGAAALTDTAPALG